MSKHKQGKDEEGNVFVDAPSTLYVACVIILLHQRIELRISKEIVLVIIWQIANHYLYRMKRHVAKSKYSDETSY